MKKLFFTIACFCLYVGLFAQVPIKIEATILDEITKQPIAYANIGFIEKNVGTVSNEDGQFKLFCNESFINNNEIFQISTLGYTTLKVQASQLLRQLSKDNIIHLSPEPINLDQVLLTNIKRESRSIGASSFSQKAIGYWYWSGKKSLGGEIATRVNIKKKNTKLLDLKLQVVENLSDSIKVRVNVYNYEKRQYPEGNLLSENIYHVISIKKGVETINLRPYNISVNDDIVIGIELIEVYGEELKFSIGGNNYLGPSYTRYISQAKWRRNITNGVNFSVLTSVPSSKKREFYIARNTPEKITLYWDISLSMENRFLDKELELLSNYLKKIETVSVEAITFSAFHSKTRQFNIVKGKSADLIKYLKNTAYDGVSNFTSILKHNDYNADVVLLFSAGNTMFDQLQSEINVPVFTINSLSKANHIRLQRAANHADGHYINLRTISSKLALESLINEIDDKTDYTANQDENSLESKGNIFGIISSNKKPIQGVTVRVKNRFTETQTDVNGRYQIDAYQGDALIISSLGMISKEVLVSNINNINIVLRPDGELLKEVIVTGKVEPKKIIKTAYGEKNFDALGYDVEEITNNDITDANHDLDQIVSKLPGVIVSGEGNNKRYSLSRSIGSSFLLDYNPIIVIDDVVYVQDEANNPNGVAGFALNGGASNLPSIDFQTVKSVRVLKSLASTNRYGTLGRNGAIVIETEMSSKNIDKVKRKPSLLAKGNDYEDTLTIPKFITKKATYIDALEKANSFNEALSIYKTQKQQLSIPYFIEVSNYFKRWDEAYAYTILSNIGDLAYESAKALKTLAYTLESQGKLEEAKYVYQRIATLHPKAAQSYRDLASIYKETGNYKEALKLYGQMLNNTIEGVDFEGLEEVITNELKHLLAKHRSKIDYSNVHADYLQTNFKYDMRIVFEWNDANTEFEVQFVNPKKKFFKWSQTQFDNKAKMLEGITKGYHTEEFIIDDDEVGEWIINIESLNEEPPLNPTYLKYTVYRNYGLANESKEIKVINLNDCNQKVTLDRLINR